MKIRISLTISEDLLLAIDEYSRKLRMSRSGVIEQAVKQMLRQEQNARELSVINSRADFLNAEAADVLTYQVNS